MEGGREALARLETEAQNASTAELDRMSAAELVAAMAAADAEAVAAVGRVSGEIAQAIEEIAERLRRGGRLLYVGAGTSGRLGVLDASECPPTFNTPPTLVQGVIAGGSDALAGAVEGAEDSPEQGERDLAARELGARDVVVGIAASGRTPYVLGALAYARKLGAWTIGLSCVAHSAVAGAAELAITPVTGPEVVTGSTRLKAGTATKLVLNMLTTGTMVRLGYVYGNLMVNVQPTNAKLVDRSVRIVAQLTGLGEGEAREWLGRAGSARVAVLMASKGWTREEAEERLAAAGGSLRLALG